MEAREGHPDLPHPNAPDAAPCGSWTSGLVALLVGGVALRIGWLLLPAGQPDGDDAVFGLMARAIADGREYPLFCWGAHYGGTLSSYLGAALFRLIGDGTPVFRGLGLPFAAGYLVATHAVARAALGARSARIALLFAAVSPAIPLAYSVKIGGYAETLCGGALLLLLAVRLPDNASGPHPCRQSGLGGLGFLAGFGLYTFPLIIPHVMITGGFLLTRRRLALSRPGWIWLLAGFGVGLLPLMVHNAIHPFSTALRLGSRVLDVSRGEFLQSAMSIETVLGWIVRYTAALPTRLLTALGNAGPLLGLEGVPGAIVAWGLILGALWALGSRQTGPDRAPLSRDVRRCCAWLIPVATGFVWLAGLDRPRHLMPLWSVLPIGCAALCARAERIRPAVGRLLQLLMIGSAVWSLIVAAPLRAGAPVESLHRATDRLGVPGIYADYEIAYLVMYASRERLLASPIAWTQGAVISDRTPATTARVDGLPNPGYVFRHDSPQAAWFVAGLERRGITYRRHRVDSFDLITEVSRPIRSREFPVTERW
jgi:hypothetical protein